MCALGLKKAEEEGGSIAAPGKEGLRFPFVESASLYLVFFCFLEGVEGLTSGSGAVPRIGWDRSNGFPRGAPPAAVPRSQAISHISQLAQVAGCPARALGKILE